MQISLYTGFFLYICHRNGARGRSCQLFFLLMKRLIYLYMSLSLLLACGGGKEGGRMDVPDFVARHLDSMVIFQHGLERSSSVEELELIVKTYEAAEARFYESLSKEDSTALVKDAKARSALKKAKEKAQVTVSRRLDDVLKSYVPPKKNRRKTDK